MNIRVLGFAAVSFTASAAFADPVPECPDTYKDLSDAQKAGEFTCKCDTGGREIFGTNIYTADSWICAAAIHVGLVDAKTHTGVVTVKGAPGCATYAASEGPGVTSKSWGKYEASFYFPAKGDGKCVETELPTPKMKNAALEKAVADAYKRDYENTAIKVILFGWDDEYEKDAFGRVTGRDLSATVAAKLPDGSCTLHSEYWLQYGNGRSFSGPLSARGAGSAEDTPISCDKIMGAAKPAKAAPKKK